MKAISHFLRITVLGGVLFLTPIVVLVFILDKAFDFARRALKPVAAIIPDRLVSGRPDGSAIGDRPHCDLVFPFRSVCPDPAGARNCGRVGVFRALKGSCL